MRSMEEFNEKENSVNFEDASVEQLELDKLGFIVSEVKSEGRPSFKPIC